MLPRGSSSDLVYIKSVSIIGFKSFGNERQTFKFGPGLNLIAGPNGAGKSNILDAVSFALCAKPASFRVQHLSELQSTDTDEPCEVELEIVCQNGGSQRIFNLEARILPNSTRQYKLGGKQKTMKDVKEFLRDHHLLLEDAFAVLQQTRVTELADSNSSTIIASVISSASGAGRWNEEVRRALEEISNTRKGLAAINHNVSLLEKAIALDEERVQALDRQKQVEYEIEALLFELRSYARASLSALEDETNDVAEQLKKTDEKKTKLLQEKATIERGVTAASGTEDDAAETVGRERIALLQKVAQAEEECRIDEKRLEQAKAARIELRHFDLQILRLHEAHEEAVRALEEKHATVMRLENDMKRFARLGNQTVNKSHFGELISDLEFEIEEKEKALQVEEERVKEAGVELTAAITGAERLQMKVESDRQRFVSLEEKRVRTARARAELVAEIDQLRQKKGELGKVKDATERRARVAAALLGRMSEEEGRVPTWSLHSLFRFKPDESLQCEQYLEALNAISGSLKSICVVNTTRDAGELLSLWQSTVRNSPFSRIWPLDRLTSPDMLSKQRKFQQSFKPGEVTLPLDLLDFDPKFSKALRKAFGGYVIAANDRVARDLICTHGLWNVTLDGEVSRSGSVQGGWQGAAGNSFIGNKYKCDALWREVEAFEVELTALNKEIDLTERKEAQVTQTLLEEDARIQAYKDEINQLQAAEIELSKARLVKEEADKGLEALCQEIAVKRERLQQFVSSQKSGSEEAAFAKALEVAVEDELAQQDAVDGVLRRLEEAGERRGEMYDEMSTVSDVDIQERLSRTTASLATFRQDLARLELLQATQLLEQKRRTDERAGALKRAQECEEGIRQCDRTAEDLEKKQGQMEKRRRTLEEEVAEFEDGCEEDDEKDPERTDSIKNDKQFAAAKAKHRYLLSAKKRQAGEHPRVTMDEQVAFKERVENLRVFKERAESIHMSIEKLNEGIRTTRDKVQKANEATFKSIRTMFLDCCKSLLPDKRVDLVKIKDHVEDGVKFLFQNVRPGDASELPERASDWKSNLGELSGGQRTMLSLAFVLTVAMNGRSSLYIMDEVDAALDEQNQRRVAALVKDVIAKKSQVLCVSHNRSFQMFSDTVIQLSRREGSSKEDAVVAAGKSKKLRQE